MKSILTVIGARPQFIKAAAVSKALKNHNQLQEILLHTGQHFDANMSDIFFEQMHIPKPAHQLNIHGGSHGEMTGKMLMEIEKVLLQEKPDMVMVYGDTNSTLAGALAAAKLHIPVAHVEAGLRSYNRQMPEEINRILTDQISRFLFCPTKAAVENLHKEGFLNPPQNRLYEIIQSGDVMQDSSLLFAPFAELPENIKELSLSNGFILATLHRAENTDNIMRLQEIVEALNQLHQNTLPVVLPLHPRTRKVIQEKGLSLQVHTIEPLGYLQMLACLKNCSLVLTDSGGVQKEAFFFAKPCVTMRDETEWVELIENGVNVLAGAEKDKLMQNVQTMLGKSISDDDSLYGGGKASEKIVQALQTKLLS